MPRSKTTAKKTTPTKHKARKTTTKARKTAKPKAKSHPKPKTHAKPKAHAKPKSKKTVSKTSPFEFDDQQTGDLLVLVDKIVDLHRRTREGVKSFYGIDKILNRYNQQYTHPFEKLEAIVKYGMEKDPTDNRSKDENDLYKVLHAVGHGKMKFEESKTKMNHLYEESLHHKGTRNNHKGKLK